MGIPIGHGNRPLSPFGIFIQREMELRGLKLTEFVGPSLEEGLPCTPPTFSRYLRGRRPPDDVVEAIIEKLSLAKDKAKDLQEAVEAPMPRGRENTTRPLNRHLHRRSVRFFGGFLFQKILEQLRLLGWEAAPCELDDEYAYDFKVWHPDCRDEVALVNFIQPQQSDPKILLRAFRGQRANEPEAGVIIYMEPIPDCIELPESLTGDLFETEAPKNLDAWFFRESDETGRIVHPGNLVQVLAEYLQPTDKVKAFLKAQSQ